jgi:MATE family, multidrug efflux pump
MQKNLLQSYIAGIKDTTEGQSYRSLFTYFVPEFITSFFLYSALSLIDSWFIADLKCTTMYATQGVTGNLVHLLTKIAESFSVGTIVLCGQYNGIKDFKNVGRSAISALWITCFVGALISILLYSTAHLIYAGRLDPAMLMYGVAFLRVRALGIFFMFVYFALIGFLRGIKNTRVPMLLFIMGGIVFIFFDYVLIYGKWGFPEMKLQGSALASTIQYGTMLIGALAYCLLDKTNRCYALNLITAFDWRNARTIMSLSWPVMFDKASLAGAKLWLDMMIAPMGIEALASYTIIRNMEQFAFLPAIAFAQVITFLVSNDFKAGNMLSIKSNIKKIIFLSSLMVFTILLVFSLAATSIVGCFDKEKTFTAFAAQAFQPLSLLVFFDLLQIILSGALRGAAEVKLVMKVRLLTCFVYFIPLSYVLSHLAFSSSLLKFIFLYGSFYVGNALMSIVYIYRFRTQYAEKAHQEQLVTLEETIVPAHLPSHKPATEKQDNSIAITSKGRPREKEHK